MSSIPALTIAIPTYRRPQKLAATLSALRSQVDDRCEVWVLDNANDSEIAELVANSGVANVHYAANVANIGLAGNVLRCFEAGSAPLLWILGDDDEVSSDAIETIFSVCDSAQDAAQWNFSTFHVRDRSWACSGIDELLTNLDSFSNLNFISANIYNRARILPFLAEGYRMAGSLCPHTAITIATACQGERIAICHGQLCTRPPVAKQDSWSTLQLAESMPLLCELPCLSAEDSERLRSTIQKCGKVHDFYVASLIMNSCYHEGAAARYARFHARWFGKNQNLLVRLRRVLSAAVLRVPGISKRLLEATAKITRREAWLEKYRESIKQIERG